LQYILINPFPSTRRNGITTYTEHALRELSARGVAAMCIANDEQLPRALFRQQVRDAITTRFRPDEVIIEAPEAGSATLLLPPTYRVHIRLHCPSAFVRRHNGVPVSVEEIQDELHIVRAAYVASSPSRALLAELEPHLDISRIHVYKNPPPETSLAAPALKACDVVFMGNFSRLKGVDFLNPLMRRLPSHYSVVMVGRDSEAFEIAADVRCVVRVGAHMPGLERLVLLASARIALSLSRFENCSMLVLEALSVGTVVAGWRVGGHAEIAGSHLIRLAPFGDLDALASTIVATIEGEYPSPAKFRAATDAVLTNFTRGWFRVWEIATGTTTPETRSLDHTAFTT
jgi:glycosyltransferase involved in cell wall biosynthesis